MSESNKNVDPFAQSKIMQKELWAGFAVNEMFTTPPAAALVKFSGVKSGDAVLDVGCGTGVVAVTAARSGAAVKGLDITPALLDRARENASIAGVEIEFTEGDVEAMPYPDASFDVVLSQLGHMFAPRPEVAVSEMLRVLKPGGTVAFTTWPPEHGVGKLFTLMGQYMPKPPAGTPVGASPPQWGDPKLVADRLGDAIKDLKFDRGVAVSPALSPPHALAFLEGTFGPLTKLIQGMQGHPEKLTQLRATMLGLLGEIFVDNILRQHFLMSRAVKK